jgi:hypothetical protein
LFEDNAAWLLRFLSETSQDHTRWVEQENAMPQYHFLTRTSKAQLTHETRLEYPDDGAAIESARLALSEGLREAALERRLLDEEIVIQNEQGNVVALITCDGGAKH